MSNPVLIVYLAMTSVALIIAASNGATAVGNARGGGGVECGIGGISGHLAEGQRKATKNLRSIFNNTVNCSDCTDECVALLYRQQPAKAEGLGEKSAPLPLCSPKIPHDRAMARPLLGFELGSS
jgi:hypothetical protein